MSGIDGVLSGPPILAYPAQKMPPPRAAGLLALAAQHSFALYLILLLGGNSMAASGGPLTWLPLWRLPATGGQWLPVGVVSLLPLLSIATWLGSRALSNGLRTLAWRPDRVSWPLVVLAGLALLNILWQCGRGCTIGSAARLVLVLAQWVWVYQYVRNERPPLFGIVIVIILIQSAVALTQFGFQRDLGLRLLGEPPLDPAIPGISVVMRDGQRWLRGYGLTAHPNVLAGTLVTLLLMLPALGRPATAVRRAVMTLALAVGSAALFARLARWAAVCFALGLAINALPWLRRTWQRQPSSTPLDGRMWLSLALTACLLLAVYGDTVVGRAVNLETPVESRSLWERDRDTRLALRLVAEHPVTGVGLGQYLPAARRYDNWAELVHNVPLWLAAELGVAAAFVWLWLLLGPVWRRGAFDRFAPQTALWLSFWLLGLLQPAPHPLLDLRSALLTGLVAALLSASVSQDLPDSPPSDNIVRLSKFIRGG